MASPGADSLVLRANKLDLLERLADDLAHEIKNPLHSMVINLEVLKRRISRCDDPQAEDMLRYAGVLGEEITRVNRHVELLLRLSRPAPRDRTAPLPELLAEMSELLEIEARRRRVSVDIAPAKRFPGEPRVAAEAGRQLVLNLLLNAIDAGSAGDSIQVSTRGDADAAELVVRIPGAGNGVEHSQGGEQPLDRLPFADALASGLGGSVSVRTNDDHTLSYTCRLPAAAG